MQITKNTQNCLQLGSLLFFILVTTGSCSKAEEGLASFDGGIISQSEFLTRYQHYLTVTGLKDNLPDRKKILRSAIHEELILQDWHSKKLDDNPVSQTILKRQEEQAILDSWWLEKSTFAAKPAPAVLAKMLIDEKSRYHIQEVHYPDLASAEQARRRWTSGPLANIDDLGFITLEDVHPRLVKMIAALLPGEVSSPVRMGDRGYRLIKLVEKKIPPFIKPLDFAAAQPRLIREWQVTRSDSLVDAYTKTVLHSLDIQYHDAACRILLDIIHQTPKDKILSSLAESAAASEKICTARGGDWTIAMIAPYVYDTKVEHIEAVADLQDLKKLVGGILVRRSLIEEAKRAEIHRKPETVEAIRKRQDLWRIKTWQQYFADTVTIDSQYLTELEQAESQNGDDITYRDVELLVFADPESALISYKKLKHGVPPGALNVTLKAAPDFPADGDLGWVSSRELGQAAGLVFSQALNTWTPPWNYNGRSFLFRSTAEKIERINKDKQRQELISRIRSVGAPVQLEQALSIMEKEYHVEINQERIKEIPYIQASGPINES